MGRTPKYERKDIVGATLRLVADRGPQAVTVAAVASEVGAPTGSIYHRYPSRERLLAELWMEVVEGFQSSFVAALATANDIEGAGKAVRSMAAWTRDHALEARLLLLHRRQDFVPGDWPPELVQRAASLDPQLGSALRAFARRAFGQVERDSMAVLRFALLDAPFGGIKPYVQAGKPVPPIVDELIERGAHAILSTLQPTRRDARAKGASRSRT